MALCHITGTLFIPDGSEASNRRIQFQKLATDVVTDDYAGAVVPEAIPTKTDANGDVDVYLITGYYVGTVLDRRGNRSYTFKATVPEQSTANIADLITASDPVEPLPAWLQEAWAARDAAEAAEAGAIAAAEDAQDSADAAADSAADAAALLAEGDLAQGALTIGTRNSVEALTISPDVNTIQTDGYAVSGDGGAALYKRVAVEPAHSGKVQSLDGAWWELSVDVLTPYMFGAKGDGVADDTIPLQSAMSLDNPLYIHGVFNISSECNYSGGLTKRVYGDGDSSSLVVMTSASGNGLSKTSGTLIIQDIGVTTSIDKDANTSAVFIGGAYSGRDLIDNCRVYGRSNTERLGIGVSVETDVIPTIRNNYIVNCRTYGVYLANTIVNGGGEAVVSGNTFNTSDPLNTGVAIAWSSGIGTLRVSGNIIQSYQTGVGAYPAASVTKGAIILTGNSFETNGYSSIAILRNSGGGEIRSVVISGNEFDNVSGRHLIVQDAGGDDAFFVRQINMSGNNHIIGISDSVLIQAGVALSISGEVFESASAGLNAISISPTNPITGNIGTISAFGSGITKYNTNGNPGILVVNEIPA